MVLKTVVRTINTSLDKAVEYKYCEKIADPGKPIPPDVRFIGGMFVRSPHFEDKFYLRETNGGGIMFSYDVQQPTLCSEVSEKGVPNFEGLSDDDIAKGLDEYRELGYDNEQIAKWLENGHYLDVTQGFKPKLPSAKVDPSTIMDAFFEADNAIKAEYAKLPKNPTIRTKWLREWYMSR